MRILLISTMAITTPPQGYGGIEWVVYWLAKALSNEGHEVGIVALEGSTPPNDKVKVYIAASFAERFNEALVAERIDSIVTQFKPDIVNDHSHGKYCFSYFREKQIPFVPTSHTVGIPDLGVTNPCWTALSNAHAKWLNKNYGITPRVCYNGIEVDDDIKPITTWQNKTLPALFLGRPNPEKGALDLIDIFVRHDIPLNVIAGRLEIEQIGYALLIAQACKEYNKQTYMGAVPYKTKFEMLARSRAMVFLPNWAEPFGLTPVEAGFVGTPTITNDMGAMPELVQDGKTGYIIPTQKDENGEPVYEVNRYGFKRAVIDEERFLDALNKIETLDPAHISKYNRTRFSIKQMAAQYLKVYNDVLNNTQW